MTLNQFLKKHRNVRNDYRKNTQAINFELLSQKIGESQKFLVKIESLTWLIRHYHFIKKDYYKDFFPLKKQKSAIGVADKYGNERVHDKAFFQDFYTDIEAIDF